MACNLINARHQPVILSEAKRSRRIPLNNLKFLLRDSSPALGMTAVPFLNSQSFRNQNAIEQIEAPLHEKREHSRGNSTLENSHVVVQVKAAYDRFA